MSGADPALEAEHLLELAAGGDLSTRGRWISWIERARKLPPRMKIWLIQKVKERISESAGEYLWRYISKHGERP